MSNLKKNEGELLLSLDTFFPLKYTAALGSMFKKAYGQTPSKVLDALNFALTLEHLTDSNYRCGWLTSNASNI
ncbi:MAG: hypothetical protein JWN56_1594 [Sphingobacteriales bacterium]|nr:hypothetical protein [Sphingobacteriales bacterium]